MTGQRVRATFGGLVMVAAVVGLIMAMAGAAMAADVVRLQLKWVPQAQFAGYFVAKDQGFYAAEGLDVTILRGGPDVSPTDVIGRGEADVVVAWMPDALAARTHGLPLVNIAQVFQRSGMMLVCRRDSGIRSALDFPGKTLGFWYGGSEHPFFAWMSHLDYTVDGPAPEVRVIAQDVDVRPLLESRSDCISAMSYNEYQQILDAGIDPHQLSVFRYEDHGVATLEDGLYARQEALDDPARLDVLARFVRASLRGWTWAATHRSAAAVIVAAEDITGQRTPATERRQLDAVVSLLDGSRHGLGWLDRAAADQTVRVLRAARTGAVEDDPGSFWTHTVMQRAVGNPGGGS